MPAPGLGAPIVNMRVLHIVRPAAGGMVRHLELLLPRLAGAVLGPARADLGPAGAGLELLVAAPPDLADRLMDIQTPAIQFSPLPWSGPLWRRPWLVPGLRRRLGAVVEEFRPDVVHLHGLEAALLALPVLVRDTTRSDGRPGVCVTLHNALPTFARQTPGWLLRRLEQADALIMVSPAMSFPSPKAIFIPNGIDLAENPPEPFGPAAGPLRVAVLSRLSREKGLDLIGPALRGWNQQERPLEIRIAGDGPLLNRLRNEMERSRLGDMVHFLGFLPPPAVRRLLAWSELLLLPSRSEGLPLAVLEAMAAARPVIATRVGGLPWLVNAGAGWLIEPNCPAALREALIEAWARRHELETMGQRARQRVAMGYNVDEMVARTLAVYRALQPGEPG